MSSYSTFCYRYNIFLINFMNNLLNDGRWGGWWNDTSSSNICDKCTTYNKPRGWNGRSIVRSYKGKFYTPMLYKIVLQLKNMFTVIRSRLHFIKEEKGVCPCHSISLLWTVLSSAISILLCELSQFSESICMSECL